MGTNPRSVAWRIVGSMPISVAMPQIAKPVRPQSVIANDNGVPAKADMASLSSTRSSAVGLSSGTTAVDGASLRNQGFAADGSSVFCQAIALRYCFAPFHVFGQDTWLV